MSKKYENCMFVEHVESAIYDLPNNIQKIDEIVLATPLWKYPFRSIEHKKMYPLYGTNTFYVYYKEF